MGFYFTDRFYSLCEREKRGDTAYYRLCDFYLIENNAVDAVSYDRNPEYFGHVSHIFINPRGNHKVIMVVWDRTKTKRPRSNYFEFDMCDHDKSLHSTLKRGFTDDEMEQTVLLIETLTASLVKHGCLDYR